MSAQAMAPTESEPRSLRAGDLSAQYSVGRSYATGDWIAVGFVRSNRPPKHLPVWILVGSGETTHDAVEDLQRQLIEESVRLGSSEKA